MSAKRRNVPEHHRRAIRLAISVGIAAATGFSLLKPLGGWHSRWGSQTMMGTKWAAITSVVCNAPVIAKTTEVAMERVLGTVTGGLLGYGLAMVNDRLPFLDQPFFTVIAATVVAFMSIILGFNLRLDYSGRLFIMTFILVVMAAPTTADAFVVAVTRISGIIFGVITTMVMSVVVFPKSASHQATDNLQAGLAALARLNALAWQRGAGCTAVSGELQPPHSVKMAPRGSSTAAQECQLSDSEEDTVRLLVEPEAAEEEADRGADACCDEALSEVYARMSTCQEFTAMSKSETYVFTSRGRWCLVPAFKCLPWRTALPDAEMSQVVAASRKVARLLWCLHTSLPEAADTAVLQRNCGALGFLTSLGSDLQMYFENLASAFPNQWSLQFDQLYHFIEGVELLVTASFQAAQDSRILLEPGISPGSKQPQSGHDALEAQAPLPEPKLHQGKQNLAFVCDASGQVTRITSKSAAAGHYSISQRNHECNVSNQFSPVLETLATRSQEEDVLKAATATADKEVSSDSTGTTAAKDIYISKVRWQATQFLLRRLSCELLLLNSAFVRLSSRLPPTRWESRLRRHKKTSDSELQQPLLPPEQA